MKTVLVVEDEDQIRSLLVELLGREGFRTLTASDGQAGLRLARQHLPDLIISDVEMPILNGHGMLRELQTDGVTATIPFVFLTARTDRDEVRLGMSLGADDYIGKPFKHEEILTVVRSRLARREALQNCFSEKLDQLRGCLTNLLPHELRTPLTAILGYSTILLEHPDQVGPDELRLAAGAIKTSGERLQRYVENVLLYTELASGETLTSTAAEVGDPADVLACAEEVVATLAKAHGREADVRLTLTPAVAAMSEGYVQRVLSEIVDNAFRYSPSGTPVDVVCETVNDSITFAVTDQGRGFTSAQLRDIDAFVQFDRKRHEQQGLGLGLALSRRLVARYHGQLEIDSVPAVRTLVRVRLPASNARNEEAPGLVPKAA